MYLYRLYILAINIIYVHAWYTTIVESGTTVVKTLPRSTQTSTTATASPTASSFTINIYSSDDCSGSPITSSINNGCFNTSITEFLTSVTTTSTDPVLITYYDSPSCGGLALAETRAHNNVCDGPIYVGNNVYSSYSVLLNGSL
jgi:hypothetical protein